MTDKTPHAPMPTMVKQLSDLPTQEVIDTILSREIKRMERSKEPIALIKVDVDHFKHYTKLKGENAANKCLLQIASIINDRVQRAGDVLSYNGFDEFMIVLPNTDLPGTVKLAEYVRILVDQIHIPHPMSDDHDHVTISLGIAHLTPNRNTTQETMAMIAQRGLDQAKEDGRNCSRIADEI